MKDINGNNLQQPYYDLAVMRREQQMGSEWVKRAQETFDETQSVNYAFLWEPTPEKHLFWHKVHSDNHPTIPQASLDELEAWRREKGITESGDTLKLNGGQVIYAINPCIMDATGYPSLTVGKSYIYQYEGKVEFSVTDDNGINHYFDIKEFDKYFSITPPADTDWKAMYEELLDKLEFYKKAFEGLKQTVEQNTPAVELTAEPSNFIAECAMRAMQGMLSNPSFMDEQDGYYTLKHEHTVASLAFDYAEAMAAEGRKRGHLHNTENE